MWVNDTPHYPQVAGGRESFLHEGARYQSTRPNSWFFPTNQLSVDTSFVQQIDFSKSLKLQKISLGKTKRLLLIPKSQLSIHQCGRLEPETVECGLHSCTFILCLILFVLVDMFLHLSIVASPTASLSRWWELLVSLTLHLCSILCFVCWQFSLYTDKPVAPG